MFGVKTCIPAVESTQAQKHKVNVQVQAYTHFVVVLLLKLIVCFCRSIRKSCFL